MASDIKTGVAENENDPFISLQSGRRFYLYGDADEVDIDDIAHSLSLQCRFTGHLQRFYSVAQHSVWVARWIQRNGGNRVEQAIGLFHDASEAYLTDIAKPFKSAIEGYGDLERRFEERIMERFGLPGPDEWPEIVKIADQVALMVESRDLHTPGVYKCFAPYQSPTIRGFMAAEQPVKPWNMEYAQWAFKDWYAYFASRGTIIS